MRIAFLTCCGAVDVGVVVVEATCSRVSKAAVKCRTLVVQGQGAVRIGEVVEEVSSRGGKSHNAQSCLYRAAGLALTEWKHHVLPMLAPGVWVAHLVIIIIYISLPRLRKYFIKKRYFLKDGFP